VAPKAGKRGSPQGTGKHVAKAPTRPEGDAITPPDVLGERHRSRVQEGFSPAAWIIAPPTSCLNEKR
jgi:hypothetical protein